MNELEKYVHIVYVEIDLRRKPLIAAPHQPKSTRLRTAVIVCLLTAGYFAMRIPWVLSLPLMECPDEVNHLWVVQFLCDHLRMPSAQEVEAAENFLCMDRCHQLVISAMPSWRISIRVNTSACALGSAQ